MVIARISNSGNYAILTKIAPKNSRLNSQIARLTRRNTCYLNLSYALSAEPERYGHIYSYDEEDEHHSVPPTEAHEQQITFQVSHYV